MNKGREFWAPLLHGRVSSAISHVLGEEFLLSHATAEILGVGPAGSAQPLGTEQWWCPPPIRRVDRVPRLKPGDVTRALAGTKGLWASPNPDEVIAPAVTLNTVWLLRSVDKQSAFWLCGDGSFLTEKWLCACACGRASVIAASSLRRAVLRMSSHAHTSLEGTRLLRRRQRAALQLGLSRCRRRRGRVWWCVQESSGSGWTAYQSSMLIMSCTQLEQRRLRCLRDAELGHLTSGFV